MFGAMVMTAPSVNLLKNIFLKNGRRASLILFRQRANDIKFHLSKSIVEKQSRKFAIHARKFHAISVKELNALNG